MKKSITILNLILLICVFTFAVNVFGMSNSKAYAQNDRATEIQYNIVFEENGGYEIEDDKYTYGEEYILTFDVWRDGYAFMGWTLTNDPNDNNYIYSIQPGETGDKVFYAKWAREVTYFVEHYFEDEFGDFVIDESKTEVYFSLEGSEVVAIPLVNITGFEFDSDNIFNEQKGVAGIEPITLRLYYSKILIDVLIVVENEEYGTVDASKIVGVKYGLPIFTNGDIVSIDDRVVTATPISADAQYTYAVVSRCNVETVQPGAVITFTFTRVLNKYTVTFYSNKGQYLSRSTVEYGDTAIYSGNEIQGWEDNCYTYEFDCWVTALNSDVEDDLTNVVANRSVYAKFKAIPKEFKITYNTIYDDVVYDNNYEIPTTYIYGQGVVLPTKLVVSKKYYIFEGWYLAYVPATGGESEKYYEPVTAFTATDYGDKTVYAKWSLEEYNLTIKTKNIFFESYDGFEFINEGEYLLKGLTNLSEVELMFGKVKGFDFPTNILINDVTTNIYNKVSFDGLVMSLLINSGDLIADTTIEIAGEDGNVYWFDDGVAATYFNNIDMQNKVVKISTASEFGLLASCLYGYYRYEDIDFSEYHVELVADIDLGQHAWYPMEFVFASFDGCGYTISNVKIEDIPYCEYYGLFSTANYVNANIYNLNINGSIDISSEDKSSDVYVGGLLAKGNICEILNVSTDMEITVAVNQAIKYYIGGLVGVYSADERVDLGIENCFVLGDINIELFNHYYIYVGGVVGLLNNKILYNSYYAGDINQFADYENGMVLGGLVGKASELDLFNNCVAKLSLNYNVLGYVESEGLADINISNADLMFENDMLSTNRDNSLLVKLNEWLRVKNNQKYYSWCLNGGYPIFDEPYRERYMVEKILNRVTIDGGDFAYVNEDYIVEVVVKPGYSVSSILISIGGSDYRDFVFNKNVLAISKDAIIGDIVIIMETLVDIDTPYTIKHYLEELDGSFALYEDFNIVKHGQTDTTIRLDEITEINGFVYDEFNLDNVLSGNINGDGSLVLSLYYIRETYSISIIPNINDGGNIDITLLNNVKHGTPVTIVDNKLIINDVTITATAFEDTNAYDYEFIGWQVSNTIDSNNLIIAKFSKILRTYTVTWKNGENVLEIDFDILYGSIPSYDGETPIKQGYDNYGYVFTGWTPSIVAVESDAVYQTEFKQVLINLSSAKDDEVSENIDAEIDLTTGVELDTKLIITTKNRLKHDLKLPLGSRVIDVYNITLRKGNSITNIELEGKAILKVEVPEELEGRSGVRIFIRSDNSFIEIPAEIKDGYFVFETESLGELILVASIRVSTLIIAIVILLLIVGAIVLIKILTAKHEVKFVVDGDVKVKIKLAKGDIVTFPYGYEKFGWYTDSELNNLVTLFEVKNKAVTLYGKKLNKRNKKESFEEKVLLIGQREVKINIGSQSNKFVERLEELTASQKSIYVKIKNYLLCCDKLNNYLTYDADLFEIAKESYIKIYIDNSNLIVMIYNNEEDKENTSLLPFVLVLNEKNYTKIINKIKNYLVAKGIGVDSESGNFDFNELTKK